MLSTVYIVLFYLASIVLITGIISRIIIYWKIPAPLVIPTMPAPRTNQGVFLRMLSEVTLFKSLFRANKWIWLFGWAFHVGLLLVTLRHFRYFQEPVWFWVKWVQPFGIYAGFAMMLGLFGLLARRFFVERIRYISTLSDYLILVLLIMIVLSGLTMKYIAHTDIIAVKDFMIGMMVFDFKPIPQDTPFLIHLGLVIILIFPMSKLMHAPGIFFSPTRNQLDNSRELRHQANWAVSLDKNIEAK